MHDDVVDVVGDHLVDELVLGLAPVLSSVPAYAVDNRLTASAP